jgi:hypothetical protein
MAQHIVITASGTGVGMWDTTPPQPAAVATALDQTLCFWQPLGNYPASVTNPQMGQSVQDGVNEIVRLINVVYPPGNSRGTSFILLGYSQGAIVVSHFIRDELLSATGRCYGRAGDLVAVGVWGNPCRLPGWASGNEYAGWPTPADIDGVVTGGIAGPDCLQPQHVVPHLATEVTHFWGEWVNTIGDGNDLYADAPVGPPSGSPTGLDISTSGPPWVNEPPAGTYETQIYNIVQQWWPNVIAIAKDIFKLFGPDLFEELMGIAEAIINGGMFAAAGPNASHYTYDITPIINFIGQAAAETPPFEAIMSQT